MIKSRSAAPNESMIKNSSGPVIESITNTRLDQWENGWHREHR
jgi:hypothetical protein